MSDLRGFVADRLSEHDLSDSVHQAYTSLLGLSDTIRAEGQHEDWFSWLTGASTAWKIGEYIFGADPASDAARISDHMRATLARTWCDHPDYDVAWIDLAADPEFGAAQ